MRTNFIDKLPLPHLPLGGKSLQFTDGLYLHGLGIEIDFGQMTNRAAMRKVTKEASKNIFLKSAKSSDSDFRQCRMNRRQMRDITRSTGRTINLNHTKIMEAVALKIDMGSILTRWNPGKALQKIPGKAIQWDQGKASQKNPGKVLLQNHGHQKNLLQRKE